MIIDGYVSFCLCILHVFFIQKANQKEAKTTYALRTGVANISIEIDTNAVGGFYVDVFNPLKKRLFQCLGSFPENVSEEFKGKIKLSSKYKNGIILFSVLNVTEEDAGIYKAVIEMKSEEVGRQLLIVFAQFQTPQISTTKTDSDRTESVHTFTCQLETYGAPTGYLIPVFYKWKRNGTPVEKSDKYNIQTSSLKIKNLQPSDLTDQFTCSAENDFGAKSPESKMITISPNKMPDQDNCMKSCMNGKCYDLKGEPRCLCNKGWTGLNCSEDIDECSSNPCHRGTCYNIQSGEYLCVCIPGWTGKWCESDIDECAGSPCINGGNCKNLSNDYLCQCTQGWTGKICEIAINECQSSPCRHGTCEDLASLYRCNCDGKWTGINCETAIDACSTRPCLNGRCEPKLNNSDYYDCVCKEGWSGTNCNIDASLKSYTPGAIGAGCAIIAVMLLIFGIWYRKHKKRIYRDTKMNDEEVYHDVKRVQSGDYWNIDDEQIYDIRRRIKSEALVEENITGPSDDYPYFGQEKCMETLKNGIQRAVDGCLNAAYSEQGNAVDGYLNPAYSVQGNAVLQSSDAPRNSQNSSKVDNSSLDDNSI